MLMIFLWKSVLAPPIPPMIRELLSPDDNSARSQKRKKRRGSKSSQENAKILPDSQGNIS